MPPSGPRPKPKKTDPPKDLGRAALSGKDTKPEPSEAVFKTPEEVAAEDGPGKPVVSEMVDLPKPKRRWWPQTRKGWATFGVAAALLVGSGAAGYALTRHKQSAPVKAPKKAIVRKPPAPQVLYSSLSGLPISNASLNSKPVTAVMVENSLAARPQSGLSQAGVVFEAQAEGGVTRYMALFQDTAPSNVGPIRSARPYYIQWALGFDAAYAHVGGSPDALNDIKSWGVHDMNQFYNGSFYHRISARQAPHNVYTGIDTLNQLESNKSYTSSYTGFPRAGKQAPMAQPTASTIHLAISGPYYDPSYIFDAATNTYKRSIDGTTQTDSNTGQQIAPTVVISIVLPLSRGALDASGAYYSNYNPLGDGTAYIFQNGGVTVGQWHKASNTSQITFTDTTGNAIPLNRGQTWISAIANPGQVTYTGAPASTPK